MARRGRRRRHRLHLPPGPRVRWPIRGVHRRPHGSPRRLRPRPPRRRHPAPLPSLKGPLMFRLIDTLRGLAERARRLSPARRRGLYRVAAAVVALYATNGVLDGQEAMALLYLVAAVLGVADSNVVPPDVAHRVPEV